MNFGTKINKQMQFQTIFTIVPRSRNNTSAYFKNMMSIKNNNKKSLIKLCFLPLTLLVSTISIFKVSIQRSWSRVCINKPSQKCDNLCSQKKVITCVGNSIWTLTDTYEKMKNKYFFDTYLLIWEKKHWTAMILHRRM